MELWRVWNSTTARLGDYMIIILCFRMTNPGYAGIIPLYTGLRIVDTVTGANATCRDLYLPLMRIDTGDLEYGALNTAVTRVAKEWCALNLPGAQEAGALSLVWYAYDYTGRN